MTLVQNIAKTVLGVTALCGFLSLGLLIGCKPSKEKAEQVHMATVRVEAQRDVSRPSKIAIGSAAPLAIDPTMFDLMTRKLQVENVIAVTDSGPQGRNTAQVEQLNRQISNQALQIRSGRIVNGTVATPGQLSYQVAILYSGTQSPYNLYFCGGTLIGDTWVVTAAHCFTKYLKYPDVQVLIKDIKLTAAAQGDLRPVERWKKYTGYQELRVPNGVYYKNDIALVKLQSASHLQPAQLVTSSQLEQQLLAGSHNAMVSGWGTTYYGSAQRSDDLLYGIVQLLSPNDCNGAYPNTIDDGMICAGNGITDTCQGDSGGPLVLTDTNGTTHYVDGVVSWGEGCAMPGSPGVYAYIPKFANWLEDNMTKPAVWNAP